jgi:hypothetical protein
MSHFLDALLTNPASRPVTRRVKPVSDGTHTSDAVPPSGAAASADELRRQGWTPAKPEVLPRRRTAWPAAAALGIVLIFFGVVTVWLIAIAGAVLLGIAVTGWIGELRYDAEEEPDEG